MKRTQVGIYYLGIGITVPDTLVHVYSSTHLSAGMPYMIHQCKDFYKIKS